MRGAKLPASFLASVAILSWSISSTRGEPADDAIASAPSSVPALGSEPVLESPLPELPVEPTLPTLPRSPSPLQMEIPVENLTSGSTQPHPWRVDLGVEVSTTYDDNIFIQHQNKVADFYFGVTPIVMVTWGKRLPAAATLTGDLSRFLRPVDPNEIGDSLWVRYSPTATFFARHGNENAFDEDLTIEGRMRTAKTLLDIEARYQTLSSPDVDVGNRIDREEYSGYADLAYTLTGKTSVDSRLMVDHTTYQGGLNFTDIGERITLDYKILPKATLGLGGAIGFTNVEGGSNQNYEQGLLHVHYVPSGKITFDALGGVEARQIVDGANRTTPVFTVQGSYAVGESTVILLDVSRRTETSAVFESQNIERTTVEANLRQLFFQKVYVTVGGGYQHAEYVDAGAGTTANRSDDFLYFGVSSAMDITRWCSMRVGYRFQHNESTISDFAFQRNLADLTFHVQF